MVSVVNRADKGKFIMHKTVKMRAIFDKLQSVVVAALALPSIFFVSQAIAEPAITTGSADDPSVLMSPQLEVTNGGLGLGTNDLSGARFRNGDILASRFFAPKIVNISATNPIPGWRIKGFLVL